MVDRKHRVVVTGMGAVSPLGNDVASAWGAAVEGRSGIRSVTKFDASQFESRIAGEVKNFNPEEYIPAKELRRMDRFIHYAVAVCKQAAFQANLHVNDENANPSLGRLGNCKPSSPYRFSADHRRIRIGSCWAAPSAR